MDTSELFGVLFVRALPCFSIAIGLLGEKVQYTHRCTFERSILLFRIVAFPVLRLHRPAHVDDQPIEEITKKLIAALFVMRMILFSEKRPELTGGYFKIDQLHDPDDLIVSQVQCHAQFFQNVVVCHSTELELKGKASAEKNAKHSILYFIRIVVAL